MIVADEHGLSALSRITNECRRAYPDLDLDKEVHGTAAIVTEMATELIALRQWRARLDTVTPRLLADVVQLAATMGDDPRVAHLLGAL